MILKIDAGVAGWMRIGALHMVRTSSITSVYGGTGNYRGRIWIETTTTGNDPLTIDPEFSEGLTIEDVVKYIAAHDALLK